MGLNINFDEMEVYLKIEPSDTSRLHLIFTSKKDEQMQIEFAFNEETSQRLYQSIY